MNKSPLLSIIIPTKNRQYTAVFAVDSALSILSDNFEVIVQDCSDDDSLRQILNSKYGTDARLKYFHTNQKLSMNENWSSAISNTQGKFVYAIGDDDAVLPAIMEVAEWMDSKNIEAVIPLKVQYIWKDAYLGTFSNSRLTLPSKFTGKIYAINLDKEYNRKVKNCGFGYTTNLPNLYHGFISKRILDFHKTKIGEYFNGTSLDVYSAFTIPQYLDSLYYVDYPISIWGACGKSNSNRVVSGKTEEHFKEFKNYKDIECLPNTFNAEVSVAETTIQALKDINKTDLIKLMDLSLVYAKCASFEPAKLFYYYRDYKLHKNTGNTNWNYFVAFYKFMKQQMKQRFLNFITLKLLSILPKLQVYIESITGNKKPICEDISECIEYIQAYQNKHNIKIQFNNEISVLTTPKEIWE
jgi:glycosyltransferase involved in cell wall biosynthesis